MTPIPTVLRVGYRLVRVERQELNCHGKDGEYTFATAVLALDYSLAGPELARVFLHELNHAIIQSYVDCESLATGLGEEMIVDQLAKGMVQVIRDNIDLMPWLIEVLHEEVVA